MIPIRIMTTRFFLRPLTVDDATARYSSWFDEPASLKYITAAQSDHGVESLQAFIRERDGRDDVLFLGIFVRDGCEHIGNIKLEPLDLAHGYAVMGVFIGEREWRGKGVAAEVIQHLGAWLQQTWGIREILLGVAKDNHAAIGAYEKAGFKRERTKRIVLDPESSISMILRLDA